MYCSRQRVVCGVKAYFGRIHGAGIKADAIEVRFLVGRLERIGIQHADYFGLLRVTELTAKNQDVVRNFRGSINYNRLITYDPKGFTHCVMVGSLHYLLTGSNFVADWG